MVSSSHKVLHTPICPKCGYDQSGEIATWQDQCPMEGRCPECGLEFEWANVLDPARIELKWYIEHAKSKRGAVARTPGTLKKLLFPHLYWREIGVVTQIQLSRLAVWLLFMLGCVHLFSSALAGMGSWKYQGNWGGGLGFSEYIQVNGLRCIPEELFNAIALPFAHFEYGGGWHQFHWGDLDWSSLILSVVIISVFIGMTSFWIIILTALPVTRALVQLRGIHLIRAWMMSLFVLILNFEAVRASTGIMIWSNGGGVSQLIGYSHVAFLACSIIWLQWFWIAALKVGWDIRPAWLIGILGVIGSLLAGFAIFMYIAVNA